MSRPRRSSRRTREVLAAPMVVAVITLVGLVGGLVGDGVYDLLVVASLALPLAVIVYAYASRDTRADRQP